MWRPSPDHDYADCESGLSVRIATSGGQLIRTGTYTVPTPRLTNIVVWSRRAMPATTGNFCVGDGADARQHDLTAVRVAGEHERNLQSRRFGEPARIVREQDGEPVAPRTSEAMSDPRLVQKRIPTKSTASPLTPTVVRASFSI